MTAPTIRAALERLVEALNDYDPKWDAFPEDALTAARAALAAAPEGEPSDEELKTAYHKGFQEASMCGAEASWLAGLRAVSRWGRPAAPPTPLEGEVGELISELRRICVDVAPCDSDTIEQAIARLQQQGQLSTTPPAPLVGEAGELVAWLRAYRDEEFGPLSDHPLACSLTRAAALLQQQAAELARLRSAPAVVPQPAPLAGLTAAQLQVLRDVLWSAQDEGPPGEGWASRQLQELREIVDAWQSAPPAVVPVAVSERPKPKDCDAQGRCWWGDAGGAGFVPSWRLCEQPSAAEFTHWLPAHAIPLPAPQGGEGEHG